MSRMLNEIRTSFILNKARSFGSFHRGVETILNILMLRSDQLREGSQLPSTAEAGRHITPPPKSNLIMPAAPGNEGGNNLMAKNLEELRREDPELAATVEAEIKAAIKQNPAGTAADAEKKRIQEIDAIAPAINNPALVHEAKYGEKPCSAQELAYRAICLNKDIDEAIAAVKQAYRPDNPAQ